MNISNSQSINKILIIRLSSMGDILLSSHIPRLIKNAYSGAEISFAVASQFTEIYRYNPNVDNVVSYDKSKSIKEILNEKKNFFKDKKIPPFDIVIDLQNNLRTRIFANGLAKSIIRVGKYRLNKLSLVFRKKPLNKEIMQIPDIYLKTLENLGAAGDDLGLELWLPKDKELQYYEPHQRQNRIDRNKLKIAIAPGAHHFTKRWPAEKFIELISLINKNFASEFILLGGEKDIEICKHIISSATAQIKDFSGSNSIIKTAEYLDECSLLITNDTGVMHIAAARRVPIAAIFGSTVREFGFAPYKARHIIVDKTLSCRPCTHIGRASCPKGHFDCMNGISAEDIFIKLKAFIDILEG